MKCPKCGHKFKDPARVTGGQRSKRIITPAQQLALQEARKAKRLSKPENKQIVKAWNTRLESPREPTPSAEV